MAQLQRNDAAPEASGWFGGLHPMGARHLAWAASPRALTSADVRTLMDRTLWARFGEALQTAPRAA